MAASDSVRIFFEPARQTLTEYVAPQQQRAVPTTMAPVEEYQET
jgi:hypothetical protein